MQGAEVSKPSRKKNRPMRNNEKREEQQKLGEKRIDEGGKKRKEKKIKTWRNEKREKDKEAARNQQAIHIIRYTKSDASSVVVSRSPRRPRAEGFSKPVHVYPISLSSGGQNSARSRTLQAA